MVAANKANMPKYVAEATLAIYKPKAMYETLRAQVKSTRNFKVCQQATDGQQDHTRSVTAKIVLKGRRPRR